MEAIRRIEQVQGDQLTLLLPEFFRGKRVEVIVLPFQEREAETPRPVKRRSPSPCLRDAIKMADDLIAPAVPAEDWGSLTAGYPHLGSLAERT